MRPPRLPAALLSLAVVPAAIALPVITRPHAHVHPVRSSVRVVDLLSTLHASSTARFSLVGASWAAGSVPSGAHVQVRVREHGVWSDWSELTPNDAAPDNGSADARRAAGRIATEPIWAGQADGVQTRVIRRGVALTPRGVRLTFVDPGTSDADDAVMSAPASSAWAATIQPKIYTRAQWGADESLRKKACPEGPDYSDTIKVGFVHHTDTENGYSSSEVPSIIRSIYAYHVNGNGWCDIGYNFLIDRFGRIWEGRYGGINRAVIGAHTGGFNTDSFGVAAIGDYTSTSPTSSVLSAYEHLFAWKLGMYFRDPTGTDRLTSTGGGTDKWPVGMNVLFNRISGHRDAGNTTCPGNSLYSKLPTIRSATRSLMGGISSQAADFTGDGVTDYATWDPATGNWHVGSATDSTHWGTTGDNPVPGHYLSGKPTERAVFRPSTGDWWVEGIVGSVHWGTTGDIPVPADYTGDGLTDRAVWRPSNGRWFINGRPGSTVFGTKGDIPVPADYNGDGKTDLAVFRPSTGDWYVCCGVLTVHYGTTGDIPVPGDYDGDGLADRAVWRPSDGDYFLQHVGRYHWGTTGDIPTPGGYGGSAMAELAVYRPTDGKWYAWGYKQVTMGTATFEPVVLPYAIYQAISSSG